MIIRFFLINISLFLCFNTAGASVTQRIDSLEEKLFSQIHDTIRVKVLNRLSNEYQSINTKKAESFAKEQIVLSEKIKYKSGLAGGYSNMGSVYYNTGNYIYALENYQKSLVLYKDLGDEKNMARTMSNIGATYLRIGDYVSASSYSLEALEIKQKLDDRKSLAYSYNSLGFIYYLNIGELDTARSYFLKAFEIFKEMKDHVEVANCLIIIGDVYRDKGEYTKANYYFFRALEEPGTEGNLNIQSRAQLSLGISYLFQKQYINAIQSLRRSLVIANELQDMETAAQNLKNLGICFRESGVNDSAIYYLKESVIMAEKTGGRELLKSCFMELSEAYAVNKDFKNALATYKSYTELKDSLFNMEKTREINNSQTQFKLAQKDAQIKLISKDKEIQDVVMRNLIASFALVSLVSILLFLYYNQKKKNNFHKQVSQVEMKALRAQMNPHFIFNSLNSIHKYIQLKDPDLASEYLIKFSKLMRLILENSRFQEVSLEKDLSALELYMQLESLRLNHSFSYEIFVDPQIDRDTTLLPPLILQPFVENSIWHGLMNKPGNGKIKIEIKKEGDMMVCIVEDNGIGRVKSFQMKSGNNENKSESLGMKITDARIDILNKIKKTNAIVQIIDLAEGVRVEVKLPIELSF